MQLERQVRWESQSEGNPETHDTNVLIINKRREMGLILQRLTESLKPTEEPVVLGEGTIPHSGLRYWLFQIKSYGEAPCFIDWKAIYDGEVKRDRKLAKRKSRDGLIEYVQTHMGRGSFS